MTVLVYCDIGNVRALFVRYWKYMADDIAYRLRTSLNNPKYIIIPESVLQSALMKELDHLFSSNGLSLASYNLPNMTSILSDAGANRLILEEMSYDKAALLCWLC